MVNCLIWLLFTYCILLCILWSSQIYVLVIKHISWIYELIWPAYKISWFQNLWWGQTRQIFQMSRSTPWTNRPFFKLETHLHPKSWLGMLHDVIPCQNTPKKEFPHPGGTQKGVPILYLFLSNNHPLNHTLIIYICICIIQYIYTVYLYIIWYLWHTYHHHSSSIWYKASSNY